MSKQDRRWNHNTHYYPLVLAAVPDGCRRALDVGCGEGMLARELAARVPQVVGIDKHEPSIALAREQGPDGRVEYVLGDFLEYPFPAASFGLVSCVAALHHLDPAAAEQMRKERSDKAAALQPLEDGVRKGQDARMKEAQDKGLIKTLEGAKQ